MQDLPIQETPAQDIAVQATDSIWTPKQQLHKYVWISVGCLLLFFASFPIAYWRVSSSGKFSGGAFNTFTEEQHQHSAFEK